MKKLLALGLSMAMMASLSAVAFAEEVVNNDNIGETNEKDVLVNISTTFNEGTKPSDYDTFIVNIPASHQFAWGSTDPYNATASIKGQLATASSVSVTADFGDKLMGLEDGDATLAYVAKDSEKADASGYDLSATGAEAKSGVEQTITFSVDASAWADATEIGVYSDTITFNVQYSPAV